MFVDRALVSNSFFRGRDTGVALWGATPNNKFEWRIGAFNGNGLTRTTNDNDKLQYNARLMWQPNGSQVLNQRAWVTGALYSESDFESTTTAIYAIAINWENLNNFAATTGTDQKFNAFSLDGIYKFHGFSAERDVRRIAKRTPETGAKFEQLGGFIQAGQAVQPAALRSRAPLRQVRSDGSDRAEQRAAKSAAPSTTTTRGTD